MYKNLESCMYVLPNTFTFFFCSRLVASILLPYPNNQNVSDEVIAIVEDTNFLTILEFMHRLFSDPALHIDLKSLIDLLKSDLADFM